MLEECPGGIKILGLGADGRSTAGTNKHEWLAVFAGELPAADFLEQSIDGGGASRTPVKRPLPVTTGADGQFTLGEHLVLGWFPRIGVEQGIDGQPLVFGQGLVHGQGFEQTWAAHNPLAFAFAIDFAVEAHPYLAEAFFPRTAAPGSGCRQTNGGHTGFGDVVTQPVEVIPCVGLHIFDVVFGQYVFAIKERKGRGTTWRGVVFAIDQIGFFEDGEDVGVVVPLGDVAAQVGQCTTSCQVGDHTCAQRNDVR